jgi:hypothetical protein
MANNQIDFFKEMSGRLVREVQIKQDQLGRRVRPVPCRFRRHIS